MRTILITSGKAGTGTTTVAINLALALTNYGRQIILLDANLDNPHVGLMLGKSSFDDTIVSALEGKKDLNQLVYKHQSGLKIIPGNISLEHMNKKDVSKLISLLPQLKDKAEAIILDTAVGFHRDTIELIKHATDCILVTTPDFISVTETLKLLKIIKSHKKSILGIVVNRYSDKEYEMKIENIQTLLNENVIATIPEHKSIKESLKLKYPLIYSHPSSPATEAFKKFACNLIGAPYEKEKPKEESSKMMRILDKVGLKKWYESLMEEDEE
jgi:septum site-determining protein MinD